MGSPCCMALAAIQISLAATGVPAFFNATRMVAYRSDVSSSTISTRTREDSKNICNSRSLLSRLLPLEKARAKLSEDNRAEPYLFGLRKDLKHLGVSLLERDRCGAIQKPSGHFQSCGSILRCSAMRASKAAASSFVQVPAR